MTFPIPYVQYAPDFLDCTCQYGPMQLIFHAEEAWYVLISGIEDLWMEQQLLTHCIRVVAYWFFQTHLCRIQELILLEIEIVELPWGGGWSFHSLPLCLMLTLSKASLSCVAFRTCFVEYLEIAQSLLMTWSSSWIFDLCITSVWMYDCLGEGPLFKTVIGL